MGDTARQLLTGDKFNVVLTDEDKAALQTHIDRTERRRDIEDTAAQQDRRTEAETALLDGLTQGTLTSTDIDRIDGLPDDGPGSRATFHTILDRRDAGLLENGTDPTLETDPDMYEDFLSAALDGGITTADLIDSIGDGMSVEDATLLAGLAKGAQEMGPDGPTRVINAMTQQNNQGAGNLPTALKPTSTASPLGDTPNQFNRLGDESINDWAARLEKASGENRSPEEQTGLQAAVETEFQSQDLRKQVRIDAFRALKAEAGETNMSPAEFLRRQQTIRDALPMNPVNGIDVAGIQALPAFLTALGAGVSETTALSLLLFGGAAAGGLLAKPTGKDGKKEQKADQSGRTPEAPSLPEPPSLPDIPFPPAERRRRRQIAEKADRVAPGLALEQPVKGLPTTPGMTANQIKRHGNVTEQERVSRLIPKNRFKGDKAFGRMTALDAFQSTGETPTGPDENVFRGLAAADIVIESALRGGSGVVENETAGAWRPQRRRGDIQMERQHI